MIDKEETKVRMNEWSEILKNFVSQNYKDYYSQMHHRERK